MGIKWAVFTVAGVLAAILVLPGIASAHHPEVTGDVECDDGTFQISADYFVTTDVVSDKTIRIYIENARFGETADNNVPAGMTATVSEDVAGVANVEDGLAAGDPPYFNWSDDRNQFEVNNYGNGGGDDTVPDFDNFFVLDGNYDSVDALDDDAVTVEARQFAETTNNFNDSPAASEAPTEPNPQRSATISTDDFWTECGNEYCVDGDTGVEQLSFQSTASNDCDPARICFEGESLTVTEFQANQLDGAEDGSCTPTEEPPPPPVVQVQPPAPEEEIAEVSPAVEEVVALPSAGYGETSNSDALSGVIALCLLTFGAGTIFVTRLRKAS